MERRLTIAALICSLAAIAAICAGCVGPTPQRQQTVVLNLDLTAEIAKAVADLRFGNGRMSAEDHAQVLRLYAQWKLAKLAYESLSAAASAADQETKRAAMVLAAAAIVEFVDLSQVPNRPPTSRPGGGA